MPTAILTITLNPALDLATSAPEVVANLKLRCETARVDPGGGGINVARAIRLLGGEAFALVAAGGSTGAQLMALLAREGVRSGLLAAPGDTRISLSVGDRASGAQYRFMLPGPSWAETDAAVALSMIEGALFTHGLCVLSGSQPPGLDAGFPARIAATCAARGARMVMDTAAAPLETFVADPGPGAEVLRMNHDEAETLAGHALPDRAASAGFAGTLVARGVARMVILARGDEGSVMATPTGAMHCAAPRVEVVSKVGAGDSFVGGFTLALARGLPAEEALRHGVAAASSAVMTEGTALCRLADVERLLPDCRISAI
jgi:6-phosphofructokinase 2